MPWVNLSGLLRHLRRLGVDPRDVTVYWDGEVDAGHRRSLSRYSEPGQDRATEEILDDEDYEDDE